MTLTIPDDGLLRATSTDRSSLVIGQICHGTMGGSSRMACRIANALARRGHVVHLFSRSPLPWSVHGQVRQHVCTEVAADPRLPLYQDWTSSDRAAFGRRVAAAIDAEGIEVVHYHYARPFAGIVSGMAEDCGHLRPLIVGTLHGTDLTGHLGDPAALQRLDVELGAADAVTTVSEHMRRLGSKVLAVGADMRVLPNFVEDGAATLTRACDVPPTMVHVSNFREVKDVGLLARLFLAIHKQTRARLRLVGDGPQLPRVRQLLERAGASAAVSYTGATSTPEDHLRDATVLLSTSAEESFGLALLEAMAAGLVVVARSVGGVPELVEDDVTGLLFSAQDVDGCVDRVVELLRCRARLDAMRSAALMRANAHRESRLIIHYENLYREVLATGHASRAGQHA